MLRVSDGIAESGEGNGHKIINLNKPLFNNNFGAIRNIIFRVISVSVPELPGDF